MPLPWPRPDSAATTPTDRRELARHLKAGARSRLRTRKEKAMVRRARWAVVPVILALTVSACSESDGGSSTDAGEKPVIQQYHCSPTLASNSSAIFLGPQLGLTDKFTINVTSVSGTGACVQALSTGQANVSSPAPAALATPVSENGDIGVKYFYELARSDTFNIMVKPDSPIQGYPDLKGKRVGINVAGGVEQSFAIGALKSVGLAASDVTFIAVGNGAAAAKSLQEGKVDAMSQVDIRWGTFKAQGFEFRDLTASAPKSQTFGASYAANTKWLESNKELAVEFARMIARATIMTIVNPEAVIRKFYQVYPQFITPGLSIDKQIEADLPVLAARSAKYGFDLEKQTPDLGQFTAEQWAAVLEFNDLTVKDPTVMYTNDIAAAMGDIDVKKWVEYAKNYKDG
ncbi:ABC transporter substrate-binding protein [Micromonospora sp. WMMD975]|uniref:ABC transporter substrate-binding protein n=1 Tax=Micromonospora sp. WMMD975 TaxID=3016087 RepID=UPI00249A2C35|nr:ABC transporter substrate-binding protein [Micromonospora sp. WMMD975]WFE33900.1 ABC transporter substrate-binding protein [Micromonospora sp. WMMD975]